MKKVLFAVIYIAVIVEAVELLIRFKIEEPSKRFLLKAILVCIYF